MYFQRLKDLREDRDLLQKDIAEILGISQTVYSRYERGAQTIPVMHLIKLADFIKHRRTISWGERRFLHHTGKNSILVLFPPLSQLR